ncbi:VanZ family protein [Desulfurispora thermophila]|uniref:VanZ family protein n=1 Tax=Desulfurispora thermophila TaxID=265470 RepID=UPI00035DEF0F|nr:VanZ family protein [Desulfurispora thermophila]
MRKIACWLPALLWMGVIFYLSSRTSSQLQHSFPFFKDFNPGHIIAYFILARTYLFALKQYDSLPYRPLLALLLCLIYGISDEYHQSFVPTRSPDLADLGRDMLGAGLAVLWQLTFPRRGKSREKHNAL